MARRRLRPAAPGSGELPLDPPPVSARRALIALAVFAAALIGGGVALQQLVFAAPSGSLAACRTAPALSRYKFTAAQPMCIDVNRHYTATIVTTQGQMVVTLDPRAAPQTVNNFVVLALHHYYDGMRFWRVQDWIVQTGDPYDGGRWSPGYYLPQEGPVVPKSGWHQGALGMARPPNGFVNGAQFFILKLDWPNPGPATTYNYFGQVNTAGVAVLQTLSATDHIVYIKVRVS
jgi:cyclophilin family peptidyl-prolyl cis-trans isomerase